MTTPMYTLSPFTCARLQRLPKQPVVWEGDRRPISEGMLDAFGYDSSAPDEEDEASDCILWVDGTEGALRAVTIIPADTGHEAVARTLLHAMEHPQGAIAPARPHKIVVCDREIHFFLRGALQDLDVTVDYAETLPVIDEIFDSLQQQDDSIESELPEAFQQALNHQAHRLWENAPWNNLADDQIIKVELNQWNLGTLYISVLGMAGLEYGLLLYRSLESLTQFRQTATLGTLSTRQMQQAFLSQDCLFLNFELIREADSGPLLPLPWMQSAPSEARPEFGSLHPLEGLRTALELEEAAALRICLEGLNRFLEDHEEVLNSADFPDLSSRYTLTNPLDQKPLAVTLANCPKITAQLAVAESFGSADSQLPSFELPRFRDDYVPEGAMVLLTRLPQSTVQTIRQGKHYQAIAQLPAEADMMPMVAIQTSRPKAQKLASQLRAAKGIEAVCFNPGGDPMTGDTLQLGLLHTGDGDFHLFIEFLANDAHDSKLLDQWRQWCQDSNGVCGVMVASGITGAARGKPGARENVAFFETYCKTPADLDLPPLQMSYALDWE
ncbi:MAG: DNA-binding protein [Cyanobacteria bacterium P01_H01_bin.162]